MEMLQCRDKLLVSVVEKECRRPLSTLFGPLHVHTYSTWYDASASNQALPRVCAKAYRHS